MNNQKYFEEFLNYLKNKPIKHLHLSDVCLIVNSLSGDFGCVVFEFADCCFMLTGNLFIEKEDEDICEFKIQKFDNMVHNNVKIYKSFSQKDNIAFVDLLVNNEGYFEGIELKTASLFIFVIASEYEIIVTAAHDDSFKYEFYPQNHTNQEVFHIESSVVLFPEH